MRATMLGYILTILAIVNIALVCCLFSKSIYKDEVQNDLDNSIELSMELLQQDYEIRLKKNNINITTNERLNYVSGQDNLNEMENDFINILTENLNGKVTSLEVNFFKADMDAKILSVEVIAKFNYLDGSEGVVSSYKTMIMDKTKN